MKVVLFVCCFFILAPYNNCKSQNGGEVIVQEFLARSIQNNKGGEDAVRSISIYLPPDYNKNQDKYPTIYFLPGFTTDDTELFQWLELKKLMDKAIETKQIRPVILVVPNSRTKFGGSFYTNSPLIGNWSDFIAKDVVEYVDINYRTLPSREYRGLSGHSMGGNGALKLAMLYPDVFSSVYAMSPAVLDWSNEFSTENPGFKRLSEYKKEDDVIDGMATSEGEGNFDAFYAAVFVSMARAYATSENVSNFKEISPVYFENNKPKVNDSIKKIWENNFPINMIDNHLSALKSFKGIKIDWGRNEDFDHVPTTALAFSKKLEENGIIHFSEEYLGDHLNKLGGFDGRLYTDMLPFFELFFQD